MKYLVILMLLSFGVSANPEMASTYCHFVTPQGFADNNGNDEDMPENCPHSVRQNADGTGTGSVTLKRTYFGGAPFEGKYTFNGADYPDIPCELTDPNGTQYATNNWTAVYKAETKGLEDFKDAFFTDNEDYDFNGDGIVNSLDTGIFKQTASTKVKYELSCRNALVQ